MITMRTKHVLMAMALPALFAACTSDEFVEQPTQGSLDGREVLGNLTVNVAGDADTRFDWSTAGWTFEDGDQFGAAVTDPTTLGDISNEMMLGNYIFSKNGNGYQTTSQMVEGTYLFYSYNQPESFVTKNTRDLIAFDLTTQTADLNDPEKAVSDNQLFISPLYFIEAENTTAENTIALPLRFIPYYSTAAFRIKNSTGAAFNISQIVLEGSFAAKGDINPKALENNKLYYSVPDGGNAYDLTALNPDGKLTETQVEAAYKKAYSTADLSTNPETVQSLVLDCNDYELANGKEVIAYMQVPVGKQTNMAASIIVKVGSESKEIRVENTARGNATEGYVIASNGISTAEFTRTATKAVFGVDGKNLKVLNVEKKNLREAGGFYIRSNEELLEVLAEQRGDIKIYNVDDVKLNDELIEYMNSYYAGNVTFANPIAIAVEDADGLTVDSKVTFMSDVTVEKGIVSLGENVVVSDDEIDEDGTHSPKGNNVEIVVESGKLILAGADVEDAKITVEKGELEVSAIKGGKAAGITVEAGTLNFTSSQKIGTGLIEFVEFVEKEGVKNALKVTAPANVPSIELGVHGGLTITKNTSMEISAKSTVKVFNAGALTINGSVVNNGTLTANTTETYTLAATGSISNYGTISGITNNGTIKMMDKWDAALTLGTTTGDGYVDNTVGAKLTATGNTVYSYNTGSISSISSDNVDVIVLHNAKVADDTELTLDDSDDATILLLGNNEFGSSKGMTITAKGATMQIGLKSSGDSYEAFARKVAGIAANVTAGVYSANMVTTFNKCNVLVKVLNSYGGKNRNDGTIKYIDTMDDNSGQGGAWTTVEPEENI